MRRNIYLIILFFLKTIIYAQEPQIDIEEENPLTYQQIIDSIFSGVDKSLISSGYLKQKAPTIVEWGNYTGKKNNKVCIKDSVLQLYSELYYAQTNSSIELNVFEKEEQLNKIANANNTIPIILIAITYHSIKQSAIENNLFYINNNQIKHGIYSSEQLYDEKILFAASAIIYAQNNAYNQIVITDSSFISNIRNNIEFIEINFNDGEGFKVVSINEPILYYQSNQITLDLRCILNNNDTLYTSFFIKDNTNKNYSFSSLNNNNVQSSSPPMPDFIVPIYEPSSGFHEYGIWLGCGNNFIRKPIIVIEGYDPTNKRNLTSPVNTDCDKIDRKDNNLYDLANSKYEMADKLRKHGYDIIILNYKDGKISIQDKAKVVRELIEDINFKLQAVGSNHELVIIAPSEAGLVVRFALALMEQQNIKHNTRLFVSFDAPHQGANTPLSLQYFIKFIYNNIPLLYLSNKTVELHNVMNSIPTKQMLVYHSNSMVDHLALMSQINSLNQSYGYPKKSRNVAIANGAGNAMGQGFSAGSKLYDINLLIPTYYYNVVFTTNGWALPNGGNQASVFKGIAVHNFNFTPIPIVFYSNSHMKISNAKPYDNAPGGNTTFIDMLALPLDTNPVINWLSSATVHHRGNNPNILDDIITPAVENFIPTISALDLKNTNDLFYNVNNNITGSDRIAFKGIDYNNSVTKFDAIYVSPRNEDHVICGTTLEITQFVNDEIMPDYHFLQNREILDSKDFEGTRQLTAGKNVTNRVPQGNFVVNTTGMVRLVAGEKITLKSGTILKATGNGKVHLQIKNLPTPETCTLPQRINNSNNEESNSENIISKKYNQNSLINNLSETLHNNSNKTFYINPNPNNGTFTIYVQTLNEQEQLQLSVMDVYGKQILNQQIANSVNHPIDLSAYSKGIYYVSVTGNSGFREVKKVVVN